MDLSRVSRTSAITLNECKNLIMKSPEAVVKAHPNLSKFVASWKFPMGDWKALAECACTHKRERFLKPILSTLFEEYILDLGSKMSYLCKLMEFATRRDDDGIPGPILTVFIRLLEDWSRMVGVRDGSENTRPALHSIGPQKGTNVKSLNHKVNVLRSTECLWFKFKVDIDNVQWNSVNTNSLNAKFWLSWKLQAPWMSLYS
jgi:hypothetical protein